MSPVRVDASGVSLLVAVSISTVSGKQAKYPSRLLDLTQRARQFQDLLGHHPVRKLPEIVDQNLIQNCSITR
jgi:hypothetical protein